MAIVEAGADFTEPFNVIEVAQDDRNKAISDVVRSFAQTKPVLSSLLTRILSLR